MKIAKVVIAVLVFVGVVLAQATNPAKRPTAAGASFDKLKSLVGQWEGTMDEGGKKMPATTSFRLVSDGSAVMNMLGEGTQYEMVTMFHMDNSDLLATHYCGAHNQPRLPRALVRTECRDLCLEGRHQPRHPLRAPHGWPQDHFRGCQSPLSRLDVPPERPGEHFPVRIPPQGVRV